MNYFIGFFKKNSCSQKMFFKEVCTHPEIGERPARANTISCEAQFSTAIGAAIRRSHDFVRAS
jgi:hypothetical protein